MSSEELISLNSLSSGTEAKGDRSFTFKPPELWLPKRTEPWFESRCASEAGGNLSYTPDAKYSGRSDECLLFSEAVNALTTEWVGLSNSFVIVHNCWEIWSFKFTLFFLFDLEFPIWNNIRITQLNDLSIFTVPLFWESLWITWTVIFGLLRLLQLFLHLNATQPRNGIAPIPPNPNSEGIKMGIISVLSFALSLGFSTHSPRLFSCPEHSVQSGPDHKPLQLKFIIKQACFLPIFRLTCIPSNLNLIRHRVGTRYKMFLPNILHTHRDSRLSFHPKVVEVETDQLIEEERNYTELRAHTWYGYRLCLGQLARIDVLFEDSYTFLKSRIPGWIISLPV